MKFYLRRIFYRLIYLRLPHWQRTRKAALKRADYHCQICGSARPLDIHHTNYKRLWRERPGDLIALCRSCHAGLHKRLDI